MRKQLFALILITFSLGCNKTLSHQMKPAQDFHSNLRECAVQSANDFRNGLFSKYVTKSTQSLEIESVHSIDLTSVFSATPSLDSIYVISYRGNSGFSLVASNQYSSIVLVSTESGALDSEKVFNDNANYGFDGEEILYRYVESLLCDYEAEEIKRQSKEHVAKLNPGESYNVWYTDSIVHPIVHFKWGQGYPFNKSMPSTPDTLLSHGLTTEYRGKYSVGCTNIAAIQMAAATLHPSSVTFNTNVNYDMSQFDGVSMYYNYTDFLADNYDTNVSSQLKLATNRLAYLLRWFADNNDPYYNPTNGSTGVSAEDAMTFLSTLDYGRYSNWDTVSFYNGIIGFQPTLYTMLDLGKPAMIVGYRTKPEGGTVGHAWLVDGYISQHMTRPNNNVYTRHYVHFNWGWRGQYDGYFYSTDISNRVQQDLIYDTNNASVSYVNRNYCIDTRYYSY